MRKQGKWLLLFVFIGVLLPLTSFAKQVTLSQLRVSTKAHYWRLVFDANGPIQYRTLMLRNPERIVLDFKNTTLKHSFSRGVLLNTPVKRMRKSKRPRNSLRLVLDLSYKVNVKTFTLNAHKGKPYRLVVDLIGKKQPVLAFGWPAKHKKQKLKIVKKTRLRAKKHKKIKAFKLRPIITASRIKHHRSRDVIILIDPGHGGRDPGAVGYGGTYEKNVVLAISKKLQKVINHQPGFKAVLTRKGNYYLTLRQRLAVARREKADMFVAIHADAYRNHRAHGASVYALSSRGATSEAARWLAKRENESELMGGVSLSDKSNMLKSVLISLSQTATIRASLKIGRDLLSSLHRVARLHHNRVEQAAFVVLKSPDIPSLLVETGFLSNRYEERRLRNPRYQYKLAYAIMKGIRYYFVTRPPRGTWLAAKNKNRNRHAT